MQVDNQKTGNLVFTVVLEAADDTPVSSTAGANFPASTRFSGPIYRDSVFRNNE